MKIEVDARGQECPKPVIMTKKELDRIESGVVTTIVDNEVAKDNVCKLAMSYGYSFIIDKKDNDYYIHITKGGVEEKIGMKIEKDEEKEAVENKESAFKDLTIAIGSDRMGNGEEKIGRILIKSFIYTVKETIPRPKIMVFYNTGVFLTCEGSEVLDDLKVLEDAGVEIISCGTCLDYYNLKERLKVGQIGNMYTIYEKMSSSKNTITLG